MPVPKKVEEQAQRAEELYREAYPDQFKDTSEPGSSEGADQTTIKVDGPEAPKPDEGKAAESTAKVIDTEIPPPAPKPDAQKREDVATPADFSKEPDWKHKYDVLDGKYRAETSRMAQELESLKSSISEIRKQAEERPAKERDDADRRTKFDADSKKLDSFKQEYPDVFESTVVLVNRIASRINADITKYVDSKLAGIEPRIQEVDKKAGMSLKEQFDMSLKSVVPDYKQIDVDPSFIEWLNIPDRYTGTPKLDLLRDAYYQNDVARVARFFLDYKADSGKGGQPEPGASGSQASVVPPVDKRKELEARVSPSPARSTQQTQTIQTEGTLTRASIRKFYDDVRKGKLSDKQIAVMEARINEGLLSGSIAG